MHKVGKAGKCTLQAEASHRRVRRACHAGSEGPPNACLHIWGALNTHYSLLYSNSQGIPSIPTGSLRIRKTKTIQDWEGVMETPPVELGQAAMSQALWTAIQPRWGGDTCVFRQPAQFCLQGKTPPCTGDTPKDVCCGMAGTRKGSPRPGLNIRRRLSREKAVCAHSV